MEKRPRAGARVRHEAVALGAAVLGHEITQLAAALTYYTVLSLLPALIVVVSLLGLVGLSSDTVHSLLDTLGELGSPWQRRRCRTSWTQCSRHSTPGSSWSSAW